MLFRTLYDELLSQAAYFIGCPKSREAVVIDPQRDVDRYMKPAGSTPGSSAGGQAVRTAECAT